MNKPLFLLPLAVAATLIASPAAHANGEAKNVIFFLGDGMGPVTVTSARLYAVGEAGKLTMETMPYAAKVKTYSLDAQTTDSAPSMSAYTTGVKQRNDVISMSGDTRAIGFAPTAVAVANADGTTSNVSNAKNNCPASGNGTSVPTILEQAIAKGKVTGVVSTARLTHATPAATYSHICHRDAEYAISAQAVPGGAGFNAALGQGVDVLMGGISYYWRPFSKAATPRGRPDGRDLVAELQAKGYTFVNDRASLLAVTPAATTKVIGLYDFALAQGHMSYDLDRDATKEPSLAEMTGKAIDVLAKKSTSGFYLMVEGGRIDHALHATNAKRALQDAKAMDDAIKVALDKMQAIDPGLANTLIVVTADHDHTMGFNGYVKRGNPILDVARDVKGNVIKDKGGFATTTLVFGNGPTRKDARADVTSATALGNDYLQETAVRLAGSETHGSGDVMLFAAGAGSKTFKGTIDNTRVYELVRNAFGF